MKRQCGRRSTVGILRPNEEWLSDYILNQTGYYLNAAKQQVLSTHFIAKGLAGAMKRTYRYCFTEKKWYHFDGQIWAKQDSIYSVVLGILEQIRAELQTRIDDPNQSSWTLKTISGIDNVYKHSYVYEVITNLQGNSELHIKPDEFDADPNLINTPDGIYNLLTGERQPNSSADLCKQTTAVGPLDDQNGELCPHYMNHLKYITQGKQDVIDWIEEISGYILTGHTFTQEFYWFCGISQSGKSQLAIAWMELLGGIASSSYFISAPNTLFAQKYNEPHTEIFARLAGKRFVLIEELKNRKWDEDKLKEYLSGNPVNACYKFADTFSFVPVGKLLFLSNKQPAMDATDGGMIRRMNLLEFTKQIPAEAKIVDFGKNVLFKQEGPYILHRMIKAAQRVLLKQKLHTPDSVKESTKEYVQSNALIELFMQDGCVTGQDFSDTWKNLHTACTMWCNENGYDCPSLNSFRNTLRDLRYKTGRSHNARVVLGIGLNDTYKKKVGVLGSSYSMYN